jgi:uncharacterized membrane protein
MIMNLKQIRILVVAAFIFIVLDLVFMRVNYGMLYRRLTSMSHKDSSRCTFDGDLGAKLHPTNQQRLINVQGSGIQPKQAGFVLSYVFLLGGLYWFVLREERSVQYAMLLGLVIYGVYESTNYGLFTKWRATPAIIDTLWGSTLFGVTTAAVYALKAKKML